MCNWEYKKTTPNTGSRDPTTQQGPCMSIGNAKNDSHRYNRDLQNDKARRLRKATTSGVQTHKGIPPTLALETTCLQIHCQAFNGKHMRPLRNGHRSSGIFIKDHGLKTVTFCCFSRLLGAGNPSSQRLILLPMTPYKGRYLVVSSCKNKHFRSGILLGVGLASNLPIQAKNRVFTNPQCLCS